MFYFFQNQGVKTKCKFIFVCFFNDFDFYKNLLKILFFVFNNVTFRGLIGIFKKSIVKIRIAYEA